MYMYATNQIKRNTQVEKIWDLGSVLGLWQGSAFLQFLNKLCPIWVRFVSALSPLFGIYAFIGELIGVCFYRPLYFK